MWMQGLAFAAFGLAALLMMHITQTVPFRGGTHRYEAPEAFRRYILFYGTVAILGAAFALLAWLFAN